MGPCNPGDARTCYTGDPAPRASVRASAAMQTCAQGGTWSNCVGEVVPARRECAATASTTTATAWSTKTSTPTATATRRAAATAATRRDVRRSGGGESRARSKSPGDGVDNDCDGMVDNTPALCDHGPRRRTSTDAMDFAKAIDLCQTDDDGRQEVGRDRRRSLTLADGTGTPVAISHSIRPQLRHRRDAARAASLALISIGYAAGEGRRDARTAQTRATSGARESRRSRRTSSRPTAASCRTRRAARPRSATRRTTR